jgi:hypothetical protein
MQRFLLIVTLALVGLPLLSGTSAWGQFLPGPGVSLPVQQSPVSPYINLLRPGSSPFVNYYGLVRPQFTFQSAIAGLNQQVLTNQAIITTGLGGSPGVPITGHEAVFLNTSGYFLTNNSVRGAIGQGLAPGAFGRGGAAVGVGGANPMGSGVAAPATRGAPGR